MRVHTRRRLLALGGAALLLPAMPAIVRARTTLSAPGTVHFNPSGSDTLGDGSAGNPWQTPQGAWNNLFAGYDLAGQPLTIQAYVPSTGQQYYGGLNVSGRLPGQGGGVTLGIVGSGYPPQRWGNYAPVILRGDPTNPLGAFLYPAYDSTALQAGLSITDGASLVFEGMSIDTGRSLSDCIQIFRAALDIRNVLFGAAGQSPTSGPACNHISLAFEAHLSISGDYQINGNGQCHIDVSQESTVYANTNGTEALTITIPYNSDFSSGFLYCDSSKAEMSAVHYSGPTRGYSVVACNGGVVNTNGAKNIPGALGTFTPPGFVSGIYT